MEAKYSNDAISSSAAAAGSRSKQLLAHASNRNSRLSSTIYGIQILNDPYTKVLIPQEQYDSKTSYIPKVVAACAAGFSGGGGGGTKCSG